MSLLQFNKFDGLLIINKNDKYRFIIGYLRRGEYRLSGDQESYYIKENHSVIKDLDVSY